MKNKRGITLIALIITIIVLLILAGVSISMVVGENGVLNRATDASKKTNEAKDEELRQMAIAEAAMNFENTEYEDKNGEKVTIPAGFAVSQVEGENTVEDGLVIIDSKGNEFVWIPCSLEEYTNASWNNDWNKWKYREDDGIEWSDPQTEIGINSLRKLEENNSDSVGFFVARYEAGIPNNVDFYADSEGDSYYNETKKDISEYIPVSKKGVPVWNCLSKVNAYKLSKNMYANNSSLNSYLIDSNAWNYICDKIITNNKEDGTSWGNYKDSIKSIYEDIDTLYAYHGNDFIGGDFLENKKSVYHKGKILDNVLPGNSNGYLLELSTGASEKFKSYNIYDMAGNLCEYTTEIGTSEENSGDYAKTVVRGGSFKEGRYR